MWPPVRPLSRPFPPFPRPIPPSGGIGRAPNAILSLRAWETGGARQSFFEGRKGGRPQCSAPKIKSFCPLPGGPLQRRTKKDEGKLYKKDKRRPFPLCLYFLLCARPKIKIKRDRPAISGDKTRSDAKRTRPSRLNWRALHTPPGQA